VLPLLGFHISVSGSGGVPPWFIIGAVGLVLLSTWASVLTAKYASRKGFPFAPTLVTSLFVSFPIVIVIVIVALAPSRQPPVGAMPPHWRKW
jgi:hypothetical protein